MNEEAKTISNGLGFSSHELVPICHKSGTWESTKMANNCSGSQSLKSKGSDSSISWKIWSTPSTALKANRMEGLGFSLPSLIIFVPLGSSPAVPLLFLPSSPLASSLFEFDAIAPALELSQDKRSSRGSRETICGRVVRKSMIYSDSAVLDVGFTWLSRVGFEKSTIPTGFHL